MSSDKKIESIFQVALFGTCDPEVAKSLVNATRAVFSRVGVVESFGLSTTCADGNARAGGDSLTVLMRVIQFVTVENADYILEPSELVATFNDNISSITESIVKDTGVLVVVGEARIIEEPMPSKIPTSSPNMFRSAFDGERCRFDTECKIGSCSNNVCESGVSRYILLILIVIGSPCSLLFI